MKHMEEAKTNYKWDYFKDIEGLRKFRLTALQDFDNDMKNRVKDMFLLNCLLCHLKMMNLRLFSQHIFIYVRR